MPNEAPTKASKPAALVKRLEDLLGWVKFEQAELPEADRLPTARLDASVRAFLGEFTQRAALRARQVVAAAVS